MIPGARIRTTLNGKTVLKLKTPLATFSLRPLAKAETYELQITPRELGGALWKNSAALYEGAAPNSTNSSFGPFYVERRPGLNVVSRPASCGPLGGNAVLMWPNLDLTEKTRLFDQLDKLIRGQIPKLAPLPKPVPIPLRRAA